MRISWDKFKDVEIKPGDFYFLPRGAIVSACIVGEKISYLVARLEHYIDNKVFADLIAIKQNSDMFDYSFLPVSMTPTMLRFVESMKDYLVKGVNSPQLHNIKMIELQVILTWYYSQIDCLNLLYPVIGCNTKFENFILDNYSISTSIEDLVLKSNMSRSTFDRKFKESFGMTPLKWMEEQVRQRIISKSSEPNVTVKDVMYEVEVYNQSQFTQLCKRLFGITPSQLIKMR